MTLQGALWDQSCRIPNGCWWACLLVAPGPLLQAARLSLSTWRHGGVCSECPHVPRPASVGSGEGRLQRQRMARRGQGEECHPTGSTPPGTPAALGTSLSRASPLHLIGYSLPVMHKHWNGGRGYKRDSRSLLSSRSSVRVLTTASLIDALIEHLLYTSPVFTSSK